MSQRKGSESDDAWVRYVRHRAGDGAYGAYAARLMHATLTGWNWITASPGA